MAGDARDGSIKLPDGRDLGYAEYGSPAGQPVILFHGMPGSRRGGALFDAVAQAHGVRLIAADRPGYATSSPRRKGTLLKSVADVVALADALQLDRFPVLGVSGGGPFALACAAIIPERVTRCALMSAIGPLSLPNALDGMLAANRSMFMLGRSAPWLVGLILPGQLRGSLKTVQKHLDAGTSPLPDTPPDVFALLIADQLEAVSAGGKGIASDMRIVTRDWDFEMEKISIPVSIWHGADDILAPTTLAQYMADHIPGSTIKLIEGAGHTGTFASAGEVMDWLAQ